MSDILMFPTANRWHVDAKEIYIKVKVVNNQNLMGNGPLLIVYV